MERAAAAAAAAARDAAAAPATLPLLIFQPPLLPGQTVRLRLQEPRLLRLAHALCSAPPPIRVALSECVPSLGDAFTEADVTAIAPLRGAAVALTLRGRRRVQLTAPLPPVASREVPRATVGPFTDVLPMAPGPGAAASYAAELAALSAETRRLAVAWTAAVRAGAFERGPGQLDAALADLGAMPQGDAPADAASQHERLSLWVAALVSPCPPLSIAPDVRRAALRGRDTRARLQLVCEALRASCATMGAARGAGAALAAAAAAVGGWADGAARASGLLSRLWQRRGEEVLPPVAAEETAEAHEMDADDAAAAAAARRHVHAHALGMMPRAEAAAVADAPA